MFLLCHKMMILYTINILIWLTIKLDGYIFLRSNLAITTTYTMIDRLFLERMGYTYRNILGEGMYGTVVCAFSTHQNQKVAIKIVDTKKLHSASWEIFLSREMEIIKTLNHPNIVKTYQIIDIKKSRTVSTTHHVSRNTQYLLTQLRASSI